MAAARETFDEVFGGMLSAGVRESLGLITDLSQGAQLAANRRGAPESYYMLAFRLPIFVLESDGKVHDDYEQKPIGQGTYGTIYLEKGGGAVIKKLWLSDVDERDVAKRATKIYYKLRGFFVESLIQVILSSDASYGKYVSKPLGLYRDGTFKRGLLEDFIHPDTRRVMATGATGAAAAAALRAATAGNVSAIPAHHVFIKMETIKYPFKSWLDATVKAKGRKLEVLDVLPLFIKLAEVLAYFDRTYGFRHGDLHTGNIMVTSGNELKVIDFGMSCLSVEIPGAASTIAGKRLYRVVDYGDTDELAACASFDLLIFFTALLENQVPTFFSDAARTFFHAMFDYGSENLYDQLYAKRGPLAGGKAGEKEPVFWQTYPWELDKRVKSGGRLLRTVITGAFPHFATPKGMFDYLSAIEAATRTRPATRAAVASGAAGTAAAAPAKKGGGYMTSQQFFNPTVLPPAAGLLSSTISAAPTGDMIRPITYATFKTGGSRHRRRGTRQGTRRTRGGFSPSVMGGFIPNAQAAIVPAAMYMAYHGLVRKKGSRKIASAVKKLFKGGRRASRRTRRGTRS